MQLELFTFTELCTCALVTALKAYKSCDFELADKMFGSVSVFQDSQRELLKVTNFRPYWQELYNAC